MANKKDYEIAIRIAGEVSKSLKDATGTTKKELSAIKKVADGFNSGLKDVGPIFNGIEKTAKATFSEIVKAAKIAGVGIGAGLGFSVKVGSEFEAQMSAVGAISQANAEDMETLTKTAENLGATTQYTAKEVGDAMEYMAMAGWDAQQINNGIAGVIDLAAASGEDIGTVSDIVTDAMTAFGLSADQSAHFADILAQASARANTNVGMMGETFKYVAPVAGAMGYSAEDVAVAVGLMANQGIKASQAGTSLRSIMTNLASPSEAAANAMDDLGISLTDSEGRAKSWHDIMIDFREGMAGMVEPTEDQLAALAALETQYENGAITEEEFTAQQDDLMAKIYGAEGALKAQKAAAIAGKYGMSGLLAIVNSSDEDFEKLTQSIENCTGAANEMASVKLDNLAGDVTIFKSAMDGLGISIYNQVSDPMRDVTQAATEFVTALTGDVKGSNIISDIANGIVEHLPTAIQTVKDFGKSIGELLDPVLKLGGWFLDNPEVISGALAGIGGAIVTYEMATKVADVASGFGKLATVLTNPWAVAILAVSGAVGVLFGAFAAKEAADAEARAKNLAEHFGDVSLSLSDLKDAAQVIVDNGSLTALNESISAFESAEGQIGTIRDTVAELNKANWKVSVGIEMTEQDVADYQTNISNFVTACQKYVEDQAYGVHIGFDLMSETTGSEKGDALADSAISKVEGFFKGKQEELEGLGKQLNEYVTEAFNDGLLDIDEAQKIQELQTQMANIQSQLASSGFEAALERVGMSYSGANLTPESFQNLQAEIAEQVQAARAKYDEAFEHNVAALKTAYNDPESTMTLAEYNAAMDSIKAGYLNNLSEIELQAQQFSLNTIMDAYGDALEEAGPEFSSMLDETMGKILQNPEDVSKFNMSVAEAVGENFLDSETRDNILKLLKNLEPTTEELENLRAKYQEYGLEIPENLQKGLQDEAMMGAIAGDIDSMYLLLAGEMANSPELANLVEICKQEGTGVPDEFKVALEANQGAAKPAIDGLYLTTAEYARQVFAQGFDITAPVRVQMSAAPTPAAGTKWGGGHADGGIITSPEIAMLAEGGYPESVIPWDGSQNAFNLWSATGRAIGAFDGLLDQEPAASTSTITYSPTLQFYGGTPSKDDIVEAGRISQREFDRMMANYQRNQRRVSLA